MSNGVYTDLPANGANVQLTEKVISFPYPFPNNGNTKEFLLTFVQNQANFIGAAIGSQDNTNAPNAYLTQPGALTLQAGAYTFQRTYTQVPVTWTEKEQVSYTYPGITFGSGALWNPYGSRAPITLYAIATVVHDFSVGSAPDPDATFLVTDNGQAVDYIGVSNPNFGVGVTSPASEPGNYVISSEVKLWKGNIWEKITKTVPPP